MTLTYVLEAPFGEAPWRVRDVDNVSAMHCRRGARHNYWVFASDERFLRQVNIGRRLHVFETPDAADQWIASVESRCARGQGRG